MRGIYTYSYAAAYSWDGTELKALWKHTSDKKGQGIYAQGAHSLTVGDLNGDGFDEVMVGAAALDHDGTLLWRTGLGHGDATHLSDFDPDNEGMEVFIITEETEAKYDAALIDAKTGNILIGKPQTGGDTACGLALDCDDKHDGASTTTAAMLTNGTAQRTPGTVPAHSISSTTERTASTAQSTTPTFSATSTATGVKRPSIGHRTAATTT